MMSFSNMIRRGHSNIASSRIKEMGNKFQCITPIVEVLHKSLDPIIFLAFFFFWQTTGAGAPKKGLGNYTTEGH